MPQFYAYFLGGTKDIAYALEVPKLEDGHAMLCI